MYFLGGGKRVNRVKKETEKITNESSDGEDPVKPKKNADGMK